MFTVKVDEEIKLSLVEPSFASHYLRIVSEERDYLGKWLVWPPLADSKEFFLEFISKSLHDYADGKTIVCAMFYKGLLVGNMSLHNIGQPEDTGEIGYWISQSFQGKGIVARAVKKMLSIGFEGHGLNSIYIEAAMENTSSRAVCERLGATLEEENAKPSELHGKEVLHAIYRIDKPN